MTTEQRQAESRRLSRLLLIEAYAQDVTNAWRRLAQCEDEFEPEHPDACNEKREALDAKILDLHRALITGAMSDPRCRDCGGPGHLECDYQPLL